MRIHVGKACWSAKSTTRSRKACGGGEQRCPFAGYSPNSLSGSPSGPLLLGDPPRSEAEGVVRVPSPPLHDILSSCEVQGGDRHGSPT